MSLASLALAVQDGTRQLKDLSKPVQGAVQQLLTDHKDQLKTLADPSHKGVSRKIAMMGNKHAVRKAVR